MRSNASVVTRLDGIAPAQTEGTSVQPCCAAAPANPPIDMLVVAIVRSIVSPRE